MAERSSDRSKRQDEQVEIIARFEKAVVLLG
jgi:hypothetical protein